MMLPEEEFLLIIGSKDVEIYKLHKQLNSLEMQLNELINQRKPVDYRPDSGGIGDSPMVGDKPTPGAVQRTISEVFRPKEAAKDV